MQQTATKIINGIEYEITKPLAEQGLEFSLKVAQLVVPFAAELISAKGDLQALAAAVGRIALTLKPEDLKYLNEFLGNATQAHLPDGNTIILRRDKFLQHFQDRYDEWLTWLVFGVQTVSGSFLNGALGLGALLKKGPTKADKPSEKATEDSNLKSQSSAERTG